MPIFYIRIIASVLWAGMMTSFCLAQYPDRDAPIPNDDFVIGMYSFINTDQDEEPNAEFCDKLNYQVYTSLTIQGQYPSSQLNVLREDGFNTVQRYQPSNYATSDAYIVTLVRLVAQNGMKLLLNAHNFYHPTSKDTGINIYDNSLDQNQKALLPEYNCKAIPNYDQLIQRIYTVRPYLAGIWGHQMAEEPAYFHYYNKTNHHVDYADTTKNYYTEVPVNNVAEAVNYFRERLAEKASHQKLTIMEAYHHGRIHDNRNDGQGVYNPQDYIKNVKADAFFEGSYVAFNPTAWMRVKKSNLDQPHYLGPMWNIDYARKYIPEVHKVISIERRSNPGMEAHFHTDTTLKNANWLWFQTYQSIVKGVQGVWFWELVDTYAPDEKEFAINDPKRLDRFTRPYFPKRYRLFVAHLARELAYLNACGLLKPQTAIASKTDNTDALGLLPDVATYVKPALKAAKIKKKYHPEFLQECYGINYTIRAFKGDTVLILTNPLPIPVSATINISKAFPGRTTLDVLFTNSLDVTKRTYKTQRDSGIDWENKSVRDHIPLKADVRGNVPITLGACDVWVIRIKK